MISYIFTHKVRTSTAIAALLLISSASTHVVAQTDATPAPQLAPIAPTISLGEPIHTAKFESDDPEIRYENGFFIGAEGNGHILVRDKDGHLTGDFNLSPLENGTEPPLTDTIPPLLALHDVAVFKDGSIVASWIDMLPLITGDTSIWSTTTKPVSF